MLHCLPLSYHYATLPLTVCLAHTRLSLSASQDNAPSPVPLPAPIVDPQPVHARKPEVLPRGAIASGRPAASSILLRSFAGAVAVTIALTVASVYLNESTRLANDYRDLATVGDRQTPVVSGRDGKPAVCAPEDYACELGESNTAIAVKLAEESLELLR